MSIVTISPKYQVVIPKTVREQMQLKPGQKMQIIQIGNRIQLIPLRSVKEARGFLKGINTDITREGDRL